MIAPRKITFVVSDDERHQLDLMSMTTDARTVADAWAEAMEKLGALRRMTPFEVEQTYSLVGAVDGHVTWLPEELRPPTQEERDAALRSAYPGLDTSTS